VPQRRVARDSKEPLTNVYVKVYSERHEVADTPLSPVLAYLGATQARDQAMPGVQAHELEQAEGDKVRASLLIQSRRTQLVLQPDSDHDKAVIGVLSKLPNSHRIDFYETRVGWSNFRGQNDVPHDDLAIVFDTDAK
jgi:hypothetical protein